MLYGTAEISCASGNRLHLPWEFTDLYRVHGNDHEYFQYQDNEGCGFFLLGINHERNYRLSLQF
jgi:hypothetical protein